MSSYANVSLPNPEQRAYSLFGRIRELVLPASIVALLDARVGPEGPYGVDVLSLESRDGLKIHLPHEPRVFLSVKKCRIFKTSSVERKKSKRVPAAFLNLSSDRNHLHGQSSKDIGRAN